MKGTVQLENGVKKMKTKNYTRKQLISHLKEAGISHQIDNMELYEQIDIVLVDEVINASKHSHDPYIREPRSLITVKVYWTKRPSTYGYQAMAAMWIHVDGTYSQATGSKTGGCGYDKVSTAVASAFDNIGVPYDFVGHFGGTGEHEAKIIQLAKKLAGRKKFIIMRAG